jgi:hypothetical protein
LRSTVVARGAASAADDNSRKQNHQERRNSKHIQHVSECSNLNASQGRENPARRPKLEGYWNAIALTLEDFEGEIDVDELRALFKRL